MSGVIRAPQTSAQHPMPRTVAMPNVGERLVVVGSKGGAEKDPAWVANLAAHREEAVAEVGAERERVWRLYMLGSALGFEDGDITVYQVLTSRPGAEHALPLIRALPASAPRFGMPYGAVAA